MNIFSKDVKKELKNSVKIGIPNYLFTYDLNDELPILTVIEVFYNFNETELDYLNSNKLTRNEILTLTSRFLEDILFNVNIEDFDEVIDYLQLNKLLFCKYEIPLDKSGLKDTSIEALLKNSINKGLSHGCFFYNVPEDKLQFINSQAYLEKEKLLSSEKDITSVPFFGHIEGNVVDVKLSEVNDQDFRFENKILKQEELHF